MNYSNLIKELGRRGGEGVPELSEEEAYHLGGAMLDGGLPELELGAVLTALRMKPPSLPELLGLHRAAAERTHRLHWESREVRPLVLPTYGSVHEHPNMVPLMALLLQRLGVPVLIHGTLEGQGGCASAYVLRELGIMPATSLAQVERELQGRGLVFAPGGLLNPGLAALLALRQRLGARNCGHVLARLLDPLAGESLRVVNFAQPELVAVVRELLLGTGARALLLKGVEGEPFADPLRRPRIESFEYGEVQILFEEEAHALRGVPGLPASDVASTAQWTGQALAGRAPVPLPLINQLACCLYAAGLAQDINQAKAISAVNAGAISAPG
jgi:anthranilate phosphoribosyltransferase